MKSIFLTALQGSKGSDSLRLALSTLQGDHGQVSFRNIKMRPIEAKK